jgi:hypothetical protein
MSDRKKALQQRISSAIRWMEKQRDQNLDMVTDAGDASIWCKDEADLIMDHINAIRALIAERAAIRREALAEELRGAVQRFCDRVDAGEIRSKRTYAEFKAILALIDQDPSDGEGGA